MEQLRLIFQVPSKVSISGNCGKLRVNLSMIGALAAAYHSGAQRARVVMESWGESNLYCPNCSSPKLTWLEPGHPASDYSSDIRHWSRLPQLPPSSDFGATRRVLLSTLIIKKIPHAFRRAGQRFMRQFKPKPCRVCPAPLSSGRPGSWQSGIQYPLERSKTTVRRTPEAVTRPSY